MKPQAGIGALIPVIVWGIVEIVKLIVGPPKEKKDA